MGASNGGQVLDEASRIYNELKPFLGDSLADVGDAQLHTVVQLARELVAAVERPRDIAMETILWPTYAMCSRICIQLGLYKALVLAKTPRSVSELATQAQAESLLVGIPSTTYALLVTCTDEKARVLRVVAVAGLVREVSHEVYAATPVTADLASTTMSAAGIHFWDQSVACMAKFPGFLEARGYACPTDPLRGVFQYAFETKLEAFQKWSQDPAVFNNFNVHLNNFHRVNLSWINWFPIQKRLLDDLEPHTPVIVDCGGGKGLNLLEFSRNFPQEKDKVILQDIPAVIDDAGDLDANILKQVHDFFAPQTVQGARIYFFSRIFHDWSNPRCREILLNLKPAMKKGYSKLLIHDLVLPDTNCSRLQAGFDIHMMCMHAGMERTRRQWSALLEDCGFEIVQFHDPPDNGDGIIEAQLAIEN